MAQVMKYSAVDEQKLMTALWKPEISDDLYAFVMFAFPWGKEKTPLEKFKAPRAWQKGVLDEITDVVVKNKFNMTMGERMEVLRKAVSSGRGVGKSALVSWITIWMLTTRIGSSVIISANSENQLRTVTWGELTKWVTMAINSHWFEISATKLQPALWLSSIVEKDLQKGTRYWGAEGKLWSEENPDSYAGVHNMDGIMVIFDEASGIPDGIWSVASGFFTEETPNRFWFAFSNGRRNTGYFYEAVDGSKREFWSSNKVDARDVEGTDKSAYEQIISEYGADSNEARVEVYGEFPLNTDGQFISRYVVDQAALRKKFDDELAPVVIGIDPARSGSDSTVICVRKGRDIIALRRYKGDDTMTTVGNVIDAIHEFKPDLTLLDEGGLGYGILDRLVEQKFKVRGVNFGWKAKNQRAWGNKRAEMWGAMRDWLMTASIPQDRQLKVDLCSPTTKPNSSGTLFLESKKEMRARGLASPDAADALAITFAFPVANKDVSIRARQKYNKYDTMRSSSTTCDWMGA